MDYTKKDMDETVQLKSEWKFGSVSQKKKAKQYKNKKTKKIVERSYWDKRFLSFHFIEFFEARYSST
jgi:hypothetical protein